MGGIVKTTVIKSTIKRIINLHLFIIMLFLLIRVLYFLIYTDDSIEAHLLQDLIYILVVYPIALLVSIYVIKGEIKEKICNKIFFEKVVNSFFNKLLKVFVLLFVLYIPINIFASHLIRLEKLFSGSGLFIILLLFIVFFRVIYSLNINSLRKFVCRK